MLNWVKPLGLRYCNFFSDIEKFIGKSIDIITKDGLYNPVTLKANEQLIRKFQRRENAYMNSKDLNAAAHMIEHCNRIEHLIIKQYGIS